MLGTIVGEMMNTPVFFRVANITMSFRKWKYWQLQSLGWQLQSLGWQRRIVDLQVHIDLNHQRLQFITEQSITPNRTSITDAVDQILKYGKGS